MVTSGKRYWNCFIKKCQFWLVEDIFLPKKFRFEYVFWENSFIIALETSLVISREFLVVDRKILNDVWTRNDPKTTRKKSLCNKFIGYFLSSSSRFLFKRIFFLVSLTTNGNCQLNGFQFGLVSGAAHFSVDRSMWNGNSFQVCWNEHDDGLKKKQFYFVACMCYYLIVRHKQFFIRDY